MMTGRSESNYALKSRGSSREYMARLTPWHDVWEMEGVATSLAAARDLVTHLNQNNNNTPSSQQQQLNEPNGSLISSRIHLALTSVAIWRRRGGSSERSSVPHALETMTSLAQVIWRDYNQQFHRQHTTFDSSKAVTSTELRLTYAAAVVRGINGLADALQQQRAMAASVATLCTSLGIPIWLVDVRHEASHNELPSLPVLRLAASCLLGFLEERYVQAVCRQRMQSRATAYQFLEDYAHIVIGDNKPDMKVISEVSAAGSAALHKGSSNPEVKPVIGPVHQSFAFTEPPPSEEDEGCDASINSKSSANEVEENDEEDDTNWVQTAIPSWGRNLGTFSNRFEVLRANIKSPTSRSTQLKESKREVKRKAKPGRGEMQSKGLDKEDPPTPENVAQAFVKSVSLDVGYQVALSFLLWGYKPLSAATFGATGAVDERNYSRELDWTSGALVSPTLPSLAEDPKSLEVHAEQIRERFQPLLVTIARTWPGFCRALLVHLVDFLLMPGTSAPKLDETNDRKLYLVTFWIRFLLSRRFLDQLHEIDAPVAEPRAKKKQRADGINNNELDAPVPFSELRERMEYPLNSLCDRLCEFRTSANSGDPDQRKICLQVEQLVLEVLGDERQPTYGIDLTYAALQVDTPLEPLPALDTSKLLETATVRNRSVFSLAEIEAMLSDNVETAENISEKLPQAPPRQRPAWFKCQSWEPCAIGALPGFPV